MMTAILEKKIDKLILYVRVMLVVFVIDAIKYML